MKLATTPRWAISFADLALLLLGCFVMFQAMRPAEPPQASAEARSSHSIADLEADGLFEPGEARLTAEGAAQLEAVARTAAGRELFLASRGGAPGGDRMDSFELAAARAAAVGRALGIRAERMAMRVEGGGEEPAGQRISVRAEP